MGPLSQHTMALLYQHTSNPIAQNVMRCQGIPSIALQVIKFGARSVCVALCHGGQVIVGLPLESQ